MKPDVFESSAKLYQTNTLRIQCFKVLRSLSLTEVNANKLIKIKIFHLLGDSQK